MSIDDYIKEVSNGLDFESNLFSSTKNGLMLTSKEKTILNSYEIPYDNCKGLKELIYIIEEKIDEYDSPDDLIEISDTIAERDYYNNTNK